MLAKFLHFIYPKIFKIEYFCILFFFPLFFSGQYHTHFENITINEGLPSNYVFQVIQDEKGILWGGTDKGLIKYENGKWKSFTTDDDLPGNYVNKIISDHNGGILMYLSENGLYHFNTKTEKLTTKINGFVPKKNVVFKYADIDPDYIIILTDVNNKPIYFLFNKKTKQTFKASIVKENNVDFALLKGRKIARIDVFTKKSPVMFNGDEYQIKYGEGILLKRGKTEYLIGERDGLPNSLITGFLKTREGDLLISTLGSGISVLHSTNYRNIYRIDNLDVRDIDYDSENFYLLSRGMLYILNDVEVRNKKILENGVLSFFVDKGHLYTGSFQGARKYKIKGNELYEVSNEIYSAGISKFFKNDDNICFSTYGGGIIKYSKGLQQRFDNFPFNNIENIFPLKNGYAAVSYQLGFYTMDKDFNLKKYVNKKSGLASNFVTSIYEDNDKLWIGMKNHLAFLQNDKLTVFPGDEHFAEAGMISNIFRDKKGELWVVAEKGIYKILDDDVLPVGSLNIINEINRRITKSYYQPEKNILLVATKNEISMIYLDNLKSNDKVEPPKFIGVKINDKQTSYIDKKILVPNDFKNFDFIFESVDNTLLSKKVLQYSINGKNWKNFNNDNIQEFTSLSQGDYVIKFRTKNEIGRVKVFPKKIKFKILGPFYMRWWFILGAAAILALVTGLSIYTYIKSKYSRQLEALRLERELEAERKRISRDLHDNLGAYTTSLISKVDKLRSTDENKTQMRDIRENAEYIMSLIRQTIWILGTKETTVDNYVDSFKNYAFKYFGSHSNIKVIFNDEIKSERLLDSALTMSLFRMIQEVLQNILKHSEATEVIIDFISDEKMFLRIRDNGKGFDIKTLSNGNGLKNLKERSKEMKVDFKIWSDKNGTVVEFKEL